MNGSTTIDTTFISLVTDFGFKRIFGSEKRKHLLIRFLNALLGDGITVTDVKFLQTEKLPEHMDGKRIIYDVSFHTNVNYDGEEPAWVVQDRIWRRRMDPRSSEDGVTHHFIMEMQNLYKAFFNERILYYAAKAVADQGVKGWHYMMKPVVVVAVTSFDNPSLGRHLVHDMVMMDRKHGDVLTEKFRIMFLSLPQVPEWDECGTELERILFLIKNMETMDKESKPYITGEYDEFFEAAETQQLVAEEAVCYSESRQRLIDEERDRLADRWYWRDRWREEWLAEGKAEGKAEGRAEGREKERRKMAKALLDMEMPLEQISKVTELTVEELKKLQSGD